MNVLTGIADEAADGIQDQIRAHQEVGWDTIELRTVNKQNVASALSDAEFDEVCSRLKEAGMGVTGFASAIGNWSRPIDGDFTVDVNELETAAKRMQRLGTKFIRTMSWLPGDASETFWKEETMRRYRELAAIAEANDIYLAHENCTGWAGQSGEHMRVLIEETGSDHVVVLFDIGNTVSHGYDPRKFYEAIKDLIRYVHVKDCKAAPEGGRSERYCLPGEGDAQVPEILADILRGGYEGVISIEPHIAKVIHQGAETDPAEMFQSYVQYARHFERVVQKAREALS